MSAAVGGFARGRQALAPRCIGRYILTRELGRGTTSRVFLAHDPDRGGDVALKLYHEDNVRPERAHTRRKLFANEATLVGKLTHPNVARVLDSGEDDGRAYVVCEYLSGAEPLSAHTRLATLLPQRRVAEILFACAKALDYAHRNGVVHRDVKPSNVLLTPEGVPKLIDFGIAVTSFTGTQTVSGLIGSPSYMAPEQVREGTAIPRSDIYALGVTGYELLSGQRPFYGDNLSNLIHQVIYATPRPLARLRANVSTGLEAIIARAMEKDANKRFPDALAMAAQLARVTADFRRDEAGDLQARFDNLRHLPFFRGFGYGEVWEAANCGEWRDFTKGEEAIAAGSRARALFVVIAGEFVLERDGRQVQSLHRGQIFGELALLSGRVWGVTARAMTTARVVRFDRALLEAASPACQLAFHKAFNETLLRRLVSRGRRHNP